MPRRNLQRHGSPEQSLELTGQIPTQKNTSKSHAQFAPIVDRAMQQLDRAVCQIKVCDHTTLIFTKVMDELSRGVVDEDEDAEAAPTDRAC